MPWEETRERLRDRARHLAMRAAGCDHPTETKRLAEEAADIYAALERDEEHGDAWLKLWNEHQASKAECAVLRQRVEELKRAAGAEQRAKWGEEQDKTHWRERAEAAEDEVTRLKQDNFLINKHRDELEAKLEELERRAHQECVDKVAARRFRLRAEAAEAKLTKLRNEANRIAELEAKLARVVEAAKSSPLVSYTPVDGEAIRVVPVSVVLAAVKEGEPCQCGGPNVCSCNPDTCTCSRCWSAKGE